jgi:hypothetical protein
VTGITVLATRHVLVDITGVRQLGALASELARQTADRARAQQDVVLTDAQKLDLDHLYDLLALPIRARIIQGLVCSPMNRPNTRKITAVPPRAAAAIRLGPIRG